LKADYFQETDEENTTLKIGPGEWSREVM